MPETLNYRSRERIRIRIQIHPTTYVAVAVAILHFIGSTWFFFHGFSNWYMSDEAPQGRDPVTTQVLMMYEFPAFPWLDRFGYGPVTLTNAVFWGTFVFVVSRIVMTITR